MTHRKIASLLLVALALSAPVSAQDLDAGEETEAPATARPSSLSEASRTGTSLRIGTGTRGGPIPEYYTVRRGDTLWDITGRFYANPWQWPRVWSYNPEVTNPHWIYPLNQVRLLPPGQMVAEIPTASTAPGRAAPGSVYLREEAFLDVEALDEAGTIVGAAEEHMLLSPSDEAYVRFREGQRLPENGVFAVFSEVPGNDRLREEAGTLVRIFGEVRVASYDQETGLARVVVLEALDPIERGMRVAPVRREFQMVPPRPATRNAVAHVIAAPRPTRLMAAEQLVFVDIGAEQGVEVGNRLFCIRRGDTWRREQEREIEMGNTVRMPTQPSTYPIEVIAEGRVVSVRPRTAALILTSSTTDVTFGDRFEMRQGY